MYNRPQERFRDAIFPGRLFHEEKYALHDISFALDRGCCMGIIGENGSGKSTLLKILCGVMYPTGGTVSVNGRIAALLELGAGFNPDYTGLENIFLNGRMMQLSRTEIEERMEAIIGFADIGNYIYQPLKTYSSGMASRLAFALAINTDADILIVDEALSVGDTAFQNKCFMKFEELMRKGATILFVSHDIESVRRMTTCALWLREGCCELFGGTADVCNAYEAYILRKNNLQAVPAYQKTGSYETAHQKKTEYPPVLPNNRNILHPDVRILSCCFETGDGMVTQEVTCGQAYRLVVTFESDREWTDIIVGFVLRNRKSQSIINQNTLTADRREGLMIHRQSWNCVKFAMTFPSVYADDYFMDCAVARGQDVVGSKMLTWCYSALRFHVRNPDPCLALMNLDLKISVFSEETQTGMR